MDYVSANVKKDASGALNYEPYQDDLTGFSYRVIDRDDEGNPLDDSLRRIIAFGTFRGQRVYLKSWVSVEFIEDARALDEFLKRSLLDWAKENWPPKE